MNATLASAALCCAVLVLSAGAPGRIPDGVVGSWTGTADIVVSWTIQKKLNVHLVIDLGGRVTGSVGDAALVEGRVKRNRGALLRALNWKTDYIVVGRLDGPVIAAERIERAAVSIPFNLLDGNIRGGIHTTGTKFGGSEGGKLSAGRMVLVRSAVP
jgi:hypothetical protein